MHTLNFDGCSKGNPGPAGAGAVIYYLDSECSAEYKYLGDHYSNNQAEYAGLIMGLERAKRLDIKRLKVEGDSLLIINQMRGTYKCNSPNLLDLYKQAKELETWFEHIEYSHVLRHKNKRADALANMAMKDQLKEKEPN